MRLWYSSHRRPAKAQVSLCSLTRAFSVRTHDGSRQRVRPKIRHLALLDGCECAFKKLVYGGRKVAKSHDMAHFMSNLPQFDIIYGQTCWRHHWQKELNVDYLSCKSRKFHTKMIKCTRFMLECNTKILQEKESIMVVRSKLKMLSLAIPP